MNKQDNTLKNLTAVLNEFKNLTMDWQNYYFNYNSRGHNKNLKKPEHFKDFIKRISNTYIITKR